jgi:hypothetical protein
VFILPKNPAQAQQMRFRIAMPKLFKQVKKKLENF